MKSVASIVGGVLMGHAIVALWHGKEFSLYPYQLAIIPLALGVAITIWGFISSGKTPNPSS